MYFRNRTRIKRTKMFDSFKSISPLLPSSFISSATKFLLPSGFLYLRIYLGACSGNMDWGPSILFESSMIDTISPTASSKFSSSDRRRFASGSLLSSSCGLFFPRAAAAVETSAWAWAAAITWAGVLPLNSGSQIGEPKVLILKNKFKHRGEYNLKN